MWVVRNGLVRLRGQHRYHQERVEKRLCKKHECCSHSYGQIVTEKPKKKPKNHAEYPTKKNCCRHTARALLHIVRVERSVRMLARYMVVRLPLRWPR